MSASSPGAIVSQPASTTSTVSGHWAQKIGQKHGERDRAVSLEVQSRMDRDYERHAVCLQRWPAVVDAVRVLVARYNEGTGLDTLTVIEDAVNPIITIVSIAIGPGSLIMALEGADVSVHTRDAEATATGGARLVTLDRNDEETAEYLVRNWMEQL